jgi:hypothetical protein
VAGQLDLFAAVSATPMACGTGKNLSQGAGEAELICRVGEFPLQPFQFGALEGKRRVASFGFRYDYTERRLQVHRGLRLPSHVSRLSVVLGRGSARCSALNMRRASALAGTETSRILEPCSVSRLVPPAPSAFDGLL